MLERFDDTLLDSHLSTFPMLNAEPWRVDAFIREESIIQRHRLYVWIAWARIVISAVTLGYFVTLKSHPMSPSLVVVIMSCYMVLVYNLMLFSDVHREKIFLYNFAIAVFEVCIIGYLHYLFHDTLPLSFLFVSVSLSALLLPIGLTIVLLLLAGGFILSNWLNLTPDIVRQLFDNPDIDDKLLHLYHSKNGNTLLMLLTGLAAVTLTINRLASWSFRNDVKAKLRYKQMRQVLSFNRAVVEHLKTGVIVVTEDEHILSINGRAMNMLNIDNEPSAGMLAEISPDLQAQYARWRHVGFTSKKPYRHNEGAEDVFVSFENFGTGGLRSINMMTLESVNDALQQTQEAKLAALGRLTAGVAHEIRNPLSSINSAAQLLVESSQDPMQDKLSQMILKNVKRTDQIISDILGLFTDAKANRTLLPVQQTLERLAKEFLEIHAGDFCLHVTGDSNEEVFFFFDAGQLEQIIGNLLQNALKYAKVDDLQLTLHHSLSASRQQLYIDVMDNGIGVPKEMVGQIFEPFFTGGEGSGLGLYLVRELCSANNANISYFPRAERPQVQQDKKDTTSGACFRLSTKAHFSANAMY